MTTASSQRRALFAGVLTVLALCLLGISYAAGQAVRAAAAADWNATAQLLTYQADAGSLDIARQLRGETQDAYLRGLDSDRVGGEFTVAALEKRVAADAEALLATQQRARTQEAIAILGPVVVALALAVLAGLALRSGAREPCPWPCA